MAPPSSSRVRHDVLNAEFPEFPSRLGRNTDRDYSYVSDGSDEGDLVPNIQSDIQNGEDEPTSGGKNQDADGVKVSSDITQQEPNRNAQNAIPRKRGRPAKGIAMPGQTANLEASSRSQGKRKRGISADGYRRSSRSASKSAAYSIAEQNKPRRATTAQPPKTAMSSASKTSTNKTKEFEVDIIVASRKRSGITQYLVKWKGYDAAHNTWEPAANLTHCAQALKQFNTKRK